MPSSSTSSTSSSVAATNPQLQQLFTNLFTGSLGTSTTNTLQGVMSGSTNAANTAQMYKTLQQASQPQYQQGMAQIQAQAGTAGLSNSTALTGQMGSYTNQYLSNLTNLASQMGMSETQMQSGVAGNLFSMLATAANQYYTNQSTTTTSMPWTQGFGSIMGGLAGLSGMGGIGGVASMFAM